MSRTPGTEDDAQWLVHRMLFGGWSNSQSDLDADVRRWAREGVRFVIFKKEVAAWAAIDSEAAREAEIAVVKMLLLGVGQYDSPPEVNVSYARH